MKKKRSGKGLTTIAVVIGVIVFSVVILIIAAACDRETFMYDAATTGLTAILVPIIYSLIDNRKKKKAATEKQKQKEEELKNLDKEKLDAIVIEIKARTARSAYRIELSGAENIGLTDSKFGGLPYWPSDKAYPENSKGEKLILLAQINFDKAKLHDYRLPKHGLLQFYIFGDDLSGADFEAPTAQENFRVVYHAEIDGSVTEESVRALGIKANTDFDGTDDYLPSYDEMKMSFEEMTDYMNPGLDDFDKLAADIYEELFDEETVDGNIWKTINHTEYDYLTAAFDECNFGHKMLGYPSFTQTDPRNDDEYQTLLLQIDSQDNIMWGDSGVANFFIDERALRKLDFSDVLYTWDCY